MRTRFDPGACGIKLCITALTPVCTAINFVSRTLWNWYTVSSALHCITQLVMLSPYVVVLVAVSDAAANAYTAVLHCVGCVQLHQREKKQVTGTEHRPNEDRPKFRF